MRVKRVVESRMSAFEATCPDIAATVSEAYARFTRNEMSAEDFARVFNRADMEFTQRTGGQAPAPAPRPRKQPTPPAAVAPLAFPLVDKMHFKLPVSNKPEMEETLQALYRYAVDTIMDALKQVYKIRNAPQAYPIEEDYPGPLDQLKESARKDELEHLKVMKKRPRPPPPAPSVQDTMNRDMNETALSMLPAPRAPLPVTKRKKKKALVVPEGMILVDKKEDVVQALIHLKTFDGVLGRSRAVLKRLTMGL